MEGRETLRMVRTIGGQRTTVVRARLHPARPDGENDWRPENNGGPPDSIRLVRMVRTIGGQRTTVVRADSIRLVRMVRTIGGQRTTVVRTTPSGLSGW